MVGRRVLRRSSMCVAVLAVATAACGGGKSGGKPEAVDTSKDRPNAEAIVLKLTDFPAGWTASPHESDPDEDAQAKKLADCVGAPDPTTSQTVELDGSDFSNENAEVGSSVGFVKTTEIARADLAAIRGPKLAGCVKESATTDIQRALEKDVPGAVIGSIEFNPITTKTYGDATSAFRMVATVTVQGITISVYSDLVLILKGRAEVTVSFTDVGTPFDQALETSLLEKIGSRIASV